MRFPRCFQLVPLPPLLVLPVRLPCRLRLLLVLLRTLITAQGMGTDTGMATGEVSESVC